MTANAPAGMRVEATEVVPVDEGWAAVGVQAGSTDHRLEGLDGSMLPTAVPGTAASALREASLWRPGSRRRLDAEDWWFRCRFTAPPREPESETTLRLGGIATIADVWLNGEHVLSSRNMHVAHELPVGALRPGENELVIGVAALEPLLAERRPRPRWRTRLVESQNLRWFRTTMIGRLPAFAPEPAPVGPWRGVSLVCRRLIAADRVDVRTAVEGSDGIIRVDAALRTIGDFRPQTVLLRVDGPSGTFGAPLELRDEHDGVAVHGSLRIPDVERWWPHTHGDPALHSVELVATANGRSAAIAAGSVGFRTLEASSEPGLALSVNGVPVFCRGGSLLPDAVRLDLPGDELRSLLAQARDAGLNMIRLPGVGTYGSDALFELCDELGLLVWQDFPFANLDYPIEDDDFRASIELEASQFLGRVGGRSSLAVLCGNSEIEQQVGMLGLAQELGRGPLFAEILPALVAEHGIDAHYLPSTPSGGDQPFRPNAGVAHYFGVGAYRRPLDDARRAEVRFASECLAIANVPDDAAIEVLDPQGGEVAARLVHHPTWKGGVPRDVGATWDFEDVRDHYLRGLYGVDPVDLRWSDPDRYVALSRVVSGEVMAASLGEWRRARSTCAGALLWTLNDPVPGSGWGIFDVHGRPKAAYWYARRALAPVAVWMTDEGTNGLAVHTANDTPAQLPARLTIALYRPDGVAIDSASVDLELLPHTVDERGAESILGRFADAGYAFRFGAPEHDVVVASLHTGSELRSQAFHFPLGRPAHVVPSADLGLDAVMTELGGGHALELRTRRLAYAVAIDVPGCTAEDDFVTIAPGEARTIPLAGTCDPMEQRGTVAPLNGSGQLPVRRGGDT